MTKKFILFFILIQLIYNQEQDNQDQLYDGVVITLSQDNQSYDIQGQTIDLQKGSLTIELGEEEEEEEEEEESLKPASLYEVINSQFEDYGITMDETSLNFNGDNVFNCSFHNSVGEGDIKIIQFNLTKVTKEIEAEEEEENQLPPIEDVFAEEQEDEEESLEKAQEQLDQKEQESAMQGEEFEEEKEEQEIAQIWPDQPEIDRNAQLETLAGMDKQEAILASRKLLSVQIQLNLADSLFNFDIDQFKKLCSERRNIYTSFMFDKKPAEQKLDPITLTRNKLKQKHHLRKLRLHRRKRFH